MDEIKSQIECNESQKFKAHIVEYDSSNKKFHNFYAFKISKWHIRISDFTYKLLKLVVIIACYLLIFEFKNGIILDKILWVNDIIFSCIKKIGLFLFNCTPFSSKMMQNPDFKYAIILATVFIVISSIINLFIFIDETDNVIPTILLSVIAGILNLHIHYEICYIIIKIPVFYKVLAFIALLLSNIILEIMIFFILHALVKTYFT